MNTAKRSNILFFIVVMCYVLASVFLSLMDVNKVDMGIIPNILSSQLIIFVPGMIFYLMFNKNGDFKLFKKIRIFSIILFLFLAELILPLASAANVFSQLFVENEVAAMSDLFMEMPFIVMLLIVGIIGPVCEEFVFRGVIFKGLYKHSHRAFASAVLSAAFFAFMHMNFNQALYAFILGFIFSLLDYTFDSLLPSVICHCVINSQNVLMMFVSMKAMDMVDADLTAEMDMIYNSIDGKIYILVVLAFLIIISVITTILASLLLYGICMIEKKTDRLKGFFIKPVNPERVLYVFGIISIAVCVFIIFLLDPVSELIKRIM